jgi:hypothetical protein
MVQGQTEKNYNLTIVDQNSSEKGTDLFLENCKNENIAVVKNNSNVPLNRLWNNFRKQSSCDILTFLNNDILIPTNFLSDNKNVFASDDDIGIVIHVTNNPDYNLDLEKTRSIVLSEKVRQGWDFSIMRKYFVEIPSSLDFYCGDDFLFENIYKQNKTVAICLSSPIIHLLSQTRKNNKIILNRNPIKDVLNYKLLGYKHYLDIPKYSKLEPPRNLYAWCHVAQNTKN